MNFSFSLCLRLCDQKLTTGNATNDSWNISESKTIQEKLALIIGECIRSRSKMAADQSFSIPNYIRTLFDHYCSKMTEPHFDGIDQIQDTMIAELQEHIFIDNNEEQKTAENYDNIQKVSHQKVKLLFPTAKMYINDQKQKLILR